VKNGKYVQYMGLIEIVLELQWGAFEHKFAIWDLQERTRIKVEDNRAMALHYEY
jgi:hypothetical protein